MKNTSVTKTVVAINFCFYALIFAAMKLFGVINISWWWILLAGFLMQIPFSKTILFVVFKVIGLFAMPVSWWFVIVAVVLDIFSVGNFITHTAQNSKC